jgi:hypothetical protein
MSRELFGPMGALLDEADFARAVAAIGAFHPGDERGPDLAARMTADRGFARRATAEHGDILEWPVRVRALQAWLRDARAWQATHRTPMPWRERLAQWHDAMPAATPVRFRIDLEGMARDAEDSLDVAFLARLLASPALATRGVYVAWPSLPLELGWEWPLRVAVPEAAWTAHFRAALAQVPYPNLFRMVDVAPGHACDLLLLPASIRDAMRATRELPEVHASALVVLGGIDEPAPQVEAWIDNARTQLHSGAVAIANVPTGERLHWFTAFLAELSHNATLDMALYLASREDVRRRFRPGGSADEFIGDLIPPLVEAQRTFVDGAVIADIARRIGEAATVLPNAFAAVALDRSFTGGARLTGRPGLTVQEAGAELGRTANAIAWHHETGDAFALAEFRKRVEQATGVALTLPLLAAGAMGIVGRGRRGATAAAAAPSPPVRRMRGGRRARPPGPPLAESAPPAAAPAEAPVARSVLAEMLVETASGEWTRTGGKVTATANCALDTFIGAPRAGVAAADVGLDESALPRRPEGHELTLAFTPLWQGAPAQAKRVHLPLAGDSTHAVFYMKAPADLATMRARLVVLHGYRVLQTLVVDCTPDATGAYALRLHEQVRVAQDFGERTQAPAFAGALIVNHSPAGVPGITGIGPNGVKFIEPEGVDALTTTIAAQLKRLNRGEDAGPAGIASLDSADARDLLRTLAAAGAWFTKMLKSEPELAVLVGTQPIQVVDARRGAYLPVEFFYNGKAPLPQATLCEHGLAALEDAGRHDACPNNKDPNVFCPAAFWGFSRCIERQPFGGVGHTVFRQPEPGSNTLRPLAKALFAASDRVRAEDIEGAEGILPALTASAGGVARASSWEEWQQKIGSDAPSLLVLLPHSLPSPEFPMFPALEISGTHRASVNLEPELVATDPARPPVVLLLGCSTALTEIAFMDFAREFRQNGAVLVIGTIATIRGRQTGAFIKALLAELKAAAADGTRTFDQVYLRVKQRLLARGDPFVLSLLAYGDAGWRIEP